VTKPVGVGVRRGDDCGGGVGGGEGKFTAREAEVVARMLPLVLLREEADEGANVSDCDRCECEDEAAESVEVEDDVDPPLR
jgi:hypothetical protein